MRKRSVYFLFFLIKSLTNLYVSIPATTASTTGHDTEIANTPSIRIAKMHNKNVVTIYLFTSLLIIHSYNKT